ncbi:MAG TPA: hydantoinase/oxoprolinase family protein [Acidobacteriaceae bacterium]|nr:hydantoinase/oxoprolinase family protein [Acidobacteriaceae bacterium]
MRWRQGCGDQRGEQEGGGGDAEGGSEPGVFGDAADGPGRGGADHAADVVDEAHRRAAQGGGEELARNHGETAEVSGAKEADEGPDHEQRVGVRDKGEEGHQGSGDDEIADVGGFAAPAVGDVAEADVAQKRADLHDDGPLGSRHNAEAAAAFGARQGEEARHPGEESPPGEERGGIHGGANERVEAEAAVEQRAGTHLRRALLPPDFRLGDAALDPQGDQRGRDPGKEDGAPSEVGQDDGDEGCAESESDSPGALHDGQRFAAMLRGPCFRNQSGARGPLAAHAEAEHDAAKHELERGMREPAESGRHGVDEDAGRERAHAAGAVSEPAEDEAAGGGADQGGGHQRAAHGGGEMHLSLHRTEDERVEHDVHAVEHPAEAGGEQGSLLLPRCREQPAKDRVQGLRLGALQFRSTDTTKRERIPLRAAIDTGGTFTDCVWMQDGELRVLKLFSTPGDPSQAVLEAVRRIGAAKVRHGTTLGTNAMLERRGARVAFVTTAGFEDTIAIGRQTRSDLYDWFAPAPVCIVPRDLRFGVNERVSAEGEMLCSPSDEELQALAEAIRASGAEAVAVSLLFSFANPQTERRVAEALGGLGIPVSVSHRILPEFREYERASTTVVNAYLAPKMEAYLTHLDSQVRTLHAEGRVEVMQSSGGIVAAELAAREPVRTVLSGPAGGVIGATRVAQIAGFERIIGFDMGGTSTDVFLSDAARGGVRRTRESVVAGVPVSVPMLEIHTAGAGGGSIARFDAGGMLHVGPESAGADPGPICFGRGTLATLTDANLILGRMDAGSFLGGTVPLNRERADALLREQKGPLATVEEFAAGMVRVVETEMAKAIRVISVEQGHDPRDFTLVAFGGGGPLHACSLARALRIPRVLIPAMPGALSALGILLADVVRDYSRTVMLRGEAIGTLASAFAELERAAREELDAMAETSLDLRYRGQGYELNVPWEASAPEQSLARFHAAHEQRYGFSNPERPVQIVNLRLRMRAAAEPYAPARREPVPGDGRAALFAERPVFFDRGFVAARFYDRERLVPGDAMEGPAMITEYTSATLLPPGCRAEMDAFGNIVIAVVEERA